MTPYYADESVTLWLGDALDILPTIAAGSVDCCVTDPPYVIGAVSAGNMASKAGGWADMMNSSLWFTEWYGMVRRTLRHNSSFWSFCNWRSLPVVMKSALSAGLPVTSLMVWDKEWIGPGGSQGLRPSYELCALMAQPGFAIPNRGVADVWRHKTGGHKPDGHPAQKPIALVERILRVAAVPVGGLVLDPYVGSGTTAVAAKALGLRCIAIEAEEQWCSLTAARLDQGVLDFGGVA
jgi:site-specific DNA-methyltransferase (adenine-specific)